MKRHVMKIALFGLTLVGIVVSNALAAPTAAQYGTVINLSGKQRMLSQKMSKEVMLVALDVEAKKNLANLKKTAALFDRTLKGLRDGDKGLRLPNTTEPKILKQLDRTEKQWVGFKKTIDQILAEGKTSKELTLEVAKKNLPLLSNMNRCVKLYEKDAKKSGLKANPDLARTLNLSGIQRMRIQKMSKEFFLIAYGENIEANRFDLRSTIKLFDRTLKGLRDGDEQLGLPGTKEEHIRGQLAIVKDLWSDFQPQVEKAITQDKVDEEAIKVIARLNLPLLKEMNKAVGMYEKLAAK